MVPVAQRADHRRGIILAAAQDQRTAGHQFHRALAGRAVLRQIGGIPDGGLLLAGGGAENGAGKAFLHPLAALVIKAQNFIVGIAQLAHVHRAPLAHAHAVAVAPGLQAEPGSRLLHAPKFVFGGLVLMPSRPSTQEKISQVTVAVCRLPLAVRAVSSKSIFVYRRLGASYLGVWGVTL